MPTLAAKERPILFSSPMVQAINDGRKTQTRRAIPGEFGPGASIEKWEGESWRAVGLIGDIPIRWRSEILYCPHGVCGDRLWVREAWMHVIGDKGIEDGGTVYDPDRIYYRASPELVSYHDHYSHERVAGPQPVECSVLRDIDHEQGTWRPSIHMPRWASRITLEVTDVRVQKLQDISFADCRAEGCDPCYKEQVEPCVLCDGNDPCTGRHVGEKWHFSRLWDSINGKRGFGWESNCWVWAISFKKIDSSQ